MSAARTHAHMHFTRRAHATRPRHKPHARTPAIPQKAVRASQPACGGPRLTRRAGASRRATRSGPPAPWRAGSQAAGWLRRRQPAPAIRGRIGQGARACLTLLVSPPVAAAWQYADGCGRPARAAGRGGFEAGCFVSHPGRTNTALAPSLGGCWLAQPGSLKRLVSSLHRRPGRRSWRLGAGHGSDHDGPYYLTRIVTVPGAYKSTFLHALQPASVATAWRASQCRSWRPAAAALSLLTLQVWG